MIGSKAWRDSLGEAVKGKVVKSLSWSEGDTPRDSYWVMTFEDGSEVSFNRTMTEVEAGVA